MTAAFRALLIAALVALLPGIAAAEPRTGQQIYAQMCAKCHGVKGEGVKNHYAKPLVGDQSIGELATLIAKTMPEDDPGSCTGDDARAVAEYIHGAFYSPLAQARNQPARIELARLTVRQYRHTVADLVGGFRGELVWKDERGLLGEYYKGQRPGGKDRAIQRVDPEVRFDFGEVSPEPARMDAEEFSIRWQGGLFAPETGEYEIVLDSANGAMLWLNDLNKPLIDAYVKSGKEERREAIWLLGGRVYPVKLDFFKSKKAKEKLAAITLKWKMPGRLTEVIPQRYLSPEQAPALFVPKTPFPPDDRSLGYERGTSISKEWEQAATAAALEAAGYVAANVNELAGTKEGDAKRADKLRDFCRRWVERAFRRPLTDAQIDLYVERHFRDAGDLNTAVKRVVILSLLSPRFLYHEMNEGTRDAYDVAGRLSYALWDSLPDAALLAAAAQGKLQTKEQVREQATRMAGDLRTRATLQEFFWQWLHVDRFTDLSKDNERFPDFDDALIADLRTGLDLFIAETACGPAADYRQLLLADSLYVNGRIAKYYGIDLPADAPFQRVTPPVGQSAGVLTHPYLMAGFAYTSTSSPIHRGVFVARSVLGRTLRPPPQAVQPLPPELHKQLTTRERITLQTKGESCQSCHKMINPLGFAFENFDAVGRFRAEEQDKPIDSHGSYVTRGGESVQFKNVRELATWLAGSDEAHGALVEQLFHYLIKQPVRAFGAEEVQNLRQSFAKTDYNIRRLVIAIATDAAMQSREKQVTAVRP